MKNGKIGWHALINAQSRWSDSRSGLPNMTKSKRKRAIHVLRGLVGPTFEGAANRRDGESGWEAGPTTRETLTFPARRIVLNSCWQKANMCCRVSRKIFGSEITGCTDCGDVGVFSGNVADYNGNKKYENEKQNCARQRWTRV